MTSQLMNEIPAVCERTGIGRSKLYQLMASGDLESVRVGRRRLIPEAALIQFVERLRAEQGDRKPAA
jgi:excisionase family DNA binding protein